MTEFNKSQFRFQLSTEFIENDEVAGWYELKPSSHRALARALKRDGITLTSCRSGLSASELGRNDPPSVTPRVSIFLHCSEMLPCLNATIRPLTMNNFLILTVAWFCLNSDDATM